MEENRPPRGRARGRARQTTGLPAEVIPPPAGAQPAPPAGQEAMAVDDIYADVYEGESRSSSNGNGNGGNGNGGGSGNGNGSGSGSGGNGNGNGSDEEMPGPGARIAAGFDRFPPLIRTREIGFKKIGVTGPIQKLYANYFPLQCKPTNSMRLHLVTFDPDEDNIKIRKALIRKQEDVIGPCLFEGTQLFTTKELPEAALNLDAFFPDKPEKHWKVKIEFIRVCDPLEPVVTQLYNVLIKKAQQILELTLLGRFYFDHMAKISIQNHRLQLWPGFITSMRQMENEILFNVDLTFKVCRMDDVLTFMKEVRQHNPQNYREACEAALIGTVVMTTYNRLTYKIDAINWDMKPSSTFEWTKKGKTQSISFIDYYKEKGYEVVNQNQPMIISKATKADIRRGDIGDRILIAEMCYQTGLSDDMRANFRLMKDISMHLHMAPSARIKKTVEFMRKMVEKAEIKDEMVKWGMRFNTFKPLEVNGRLLPPEEINFSRGAVQGNDKADWSMAFRNNAFLKSVPLKRWAMLFTSRDGGNIDNLIQTMRRVATPLGFPFPDVDKVVVGNPNARGFQDALKDTIGKYRGDISMIVIILPNNRAEVYAACKKVCSIEYGIPSQCFLSKNVMNKGLMSICTKLVVQMNAKVGGEPWGLKNPLQGLMVVGFDVHHGKGMKSFGAMAATTTQTLATYYSTIIEMHSGLEMCAEMGNALTRCLKAFQRINNGALPLRIIFYRDGVGEGQLTYVYRSEMESMKIAMNVIYQQVPLPKFSLIVVTKRINTRLFLRTGPQTDQIENPKPGTVVDEQITCPEKYDFYLVPQAARQGTVSPVSFNVLCDSSGLDADKMQRFTFKMCHGYFNWSGTVAVPAPCQYAHKLAFLTGTALENEVHANLHNNLHYL